MTETDPVAAGDETTAEKRPADDAADGDSSEKAKRRKRSRWGNEETRVHVPGFTTVLSQNMTSQQQEAYVTKLRIEEIGRKLKFNDLGIPAEQQDRSPSPEPIYDNYGKRLNTREFRCKKKLEDERHRLVEWLQKNDPDYKPPADYKPERKQIQQRVDIPQDEFPSINFIGLIIGPRGNTLKKLEGDTGAKVMIRGKGSVKEGRGRRDGQINPGEDEPLHAMVTGPTIEAVQKAVASIQKVIEVGKTCPEGQNELKRMQLRELASLNGTLRDDEGLRCMNCGSLEHRQWQCTEKKIFTNSAVCNTCGGVGHIARDCKFRGGAPPAIEGGSAGPAGGGAIDEEYSSFMQELSGDKRSSQSGPPGQSGQSGQVGQVGPPGGGSSGAPPPWQNKGPSSGGYPPSRPSNAYGPPQPRNDPPWQQGQQSAPRSSAPPPWQQSNNPPSQGGYSRAPPPWQSQPQSQPSSQAPSTNAPWLQSSQSSQASGQQSQSSGQPMMRPNANALPSWAVSGGSSTASTAAPQSNAGCAPSNQPAMLPTPVTQTPPSRAAYDSSSTYGAPSGGSYGGSGTPSAPTASGGYSGGYSSGGSSGGYSGSQGGYQSSQSTYSAPAPWQPSGGAWNAPPPSSGYSQPPPPSSGYSQPPPPSSGYSQPPPPSSGYTQPPPPSSGYSQPPPPSSGYSQPPPPSSGYSQPQPPSSGYSQPPPPSSGYSQPPPPPSTGYSSAGYSSSGYAGYSQPPPPSSGYSQPPPPSSGYSQPPPPSSGYSQPPPPSSGYSQPLPPSSGYSQPPPPPPSSYPPPPPSY